MSKLIRLSRGDLSLVLCPEAGGSVASFRLAGDGGELDLLRPASEQAIAQGNALDSACYPLIPFSNRIENGRLRFAGRQYQLTPNFPDHPHPLHGHACWRPWEVSQAGESSAVLVFSYQGSDYPSAYQAEQRYTLLERGLSCELRLKNVGRELMPAGLGLHPFFPKLPGTRLQAPCSGVWRLRPDGIPLGHEGIPPEWDFGQSRELGDIVLDDCFSGWVHHATIDWPSLGLRLKLTADDPLSHLVIYTPAAREFFCVEPVSNANDAFNMAARGVPDTGTVVLAPDEMLKATMRLTLERL